MTAPYSRLPSLQKCKLNKLLFLIDFSLWYSVTAAENGLKHSLNPLEHFLLPPAGFPREHMEWVLCLWEDQGEGNKGVLRNPQPALDDT